MMICQYYVVMLQILQGQYNFWTMGIVSSAIPALMKTIKVRFIIETIKRIALTVKPDF